MPQETADFAPQRSGCPIATTLDLVGDRWTLVIVRDMVTGKTRYGDFLASPEGITTNILADRLKRLVDARLVMKERYQAHPERFEYHLTDKGFDLLPVLQAMCHWANAHVAGTWTPPAWFMADGVAPAPG
ncbi:MAG: helix-turn-helix domain-containing protein [Rhodospirillaceae bacterium]